MNNQAIIIALIAGTPGVLLRFLNYWKERKTKEERENEKIQAKESVVTAETLKLMFEANKDDNERIKAERDQLKVELAAVYSKVREEQQQIDEMKVSLMTLPMLDGGEVFATWIKDRDGRRMKHCFEYERMTGLPLLKCVNKTDFHIMMKNSGLESMTKQQRDKAINQIKRTARKWKKEDEYVMRTRKTLMTIEPAFHIDDPIDEFWVLSIKSPAILNDEVLGTIGKAIRLTDIAHAYQARGVKIPTTFGKSYGMEEPPTVQ